MRGTNPPKWIGRYREDTVGQEGIVRRVKHSVVLGTKAELPTKPLAQRRLELILARINAPEYRPGRVATVAESDFTRTRGLYGSKKNCFRSGTRRSVAEG